MGDSRLPALTMIHSWEGFAGHLRRIQEDQVPIRDAAFAFDLLYGNDDPRAAQHLALLQVRVFTNLSAMIRQAMRPFIHLKREVYSYFEDEPDDEDVLPGIDMTSVIRPSQLRETKLPYLRGVKDMSGFSYHVCGIIDALDEVREVSHTFMTTCGVADEEALTALADIELQLFFHLVYHIGKLKRFLIRLNRKVYTKLDEELDFEES
jgi:hypothetical protein